MGGNSEKCLKQGGNLEQNYLREGGVKLEIVCK